MSQSAKEEMSDPTMTMQELAAYLRVHYSMILRMVHRGELPGFRVGSMWRFNRAEIDQWRLNAEGKSKTGQLRRGRERRSVP
jgi:excisionase family DNA binding protein